MSSTSGGSSVMVATPCTCTNEYGGWGSSTQMTTLESRARARPFDVFRPVLKASWPPSTTNHTGATSGRPAAATYPSIPVRVPVDRNETTLSDSFGSSAMWLEPGQVVVADVIDEDLQVVPRGAEGRLDRGKRGRVVADRVFPGHADAAVQL